MDKKEALEIVQKNGLELDNLPAHFKKNKEIVLEAVKEDGYALDDADDSLKKDREIVLEAVKQNGYALLLADDSFQKDKEVVLEALKKSGTLKDRDGKTILISLEDIDESLRNDPDILAIVNKKK